MKFRISPLSYFIMTASALYPFHLAQAANTAMTGGANLSTSGTGSSYSRGSHGSVVFAGDDDYCGADNVIGRRGVTSATGGAISAYEQFQRFMNNTAFGSYHPYGTSTSQVVWTGDGTTSGNIGYQGALTGGATSELPTAYGVYSFATGCGSYATGNYSTAFGSNATATGAAAQAFGVSALASGTASVAMGVGAEATADSAVAIGPVSAAKGVNSVALGMGAVANKDDDIALGSESETSDVVATATSQINGQQYNYAGSAPKSAVSVGSVGKERQLQNVAAGQLSATSTDGVNGSQLFATNSALDQVGANLSAAVDSLGGGAAIGTDGQFTAPKYQIQGAARGTVGDALTALDASVTSNTSNISNLQNDISSGSVGLVRQDATSKAITVAAASGGTSVDFSGSDGARTLSGIRDGKVAADSSEAVTGSQLFATRQAVETNTADIATNKADIATNTSDIAASKDDIATNTAAIGANTSAIASQGQTLSQHDGQLSGLTTALGGGAAIGTDGQFTAPEYQIQGAARGTVGDALTALDASVTSNTSNISNLQNDISSGSVGLVRQDATSKAITVAAASGGTSVDFSGSDGARTLSGIRDGKVAADSSEAVTGSQLFATRQAVETNTADIATNKADIATNTSDIAASKNDIATNTAAIGANTSAIASQGQTLSQHDGQLSGLTTALGGGAGIGTDGQFTAPEYQIQGAARGTVGDALTALDSSVTRNTSNISNLQNDISSGSVGLVRQDATSKAITVAAASGGTSVDFSGSDGARTLSGIRDGKVAADSSEAVTGSQLFATRQAVETNTADIATNTADIATNKADIATNTSDIAASKNDIATNTAAIGANTSAIASQGQTLSQHDGQLSGLTTALGGGAAISADGQFTAPEYQIQGAARGTVGDALTALDASVTSNTSNISNLQNDISSGSVGLVRQDATSKAITVAAASGGTSVDFSGSDGARTLSGIRDGKVAADSSEAVTGSQLFATRQAVETNTADIATNTADIATNKADIATNTSDIAASKNDIATNTAAIGANTSAIASQGQTLSQHDGQLSGLTTALGGGAAISADGQFTAPEYQIQGAARGTVSDALTALDTSVTRNTSNISNLQSDISSGSVGLVRQDATSKAITVAAASGGTSVDFSGSDGVRTLNGIRDGKVAADSSEAVTGSQLFATRQAVETNTADIATNTSDIAASKNDIATNTAAIGANTSAIASQGQTLSQHDGQLSGLTTALGGGAAIGTDGQFTAPEYQIQGAARGTVGDALTALDTSVTSNTSNISNLQSDISSGSVGLVRQDATSKAITVAAASGGTSVDFSGSDGARTLSGIRDGKVAADSSEAVTGSQLFLTNTTLSRTAEALGGGARVIAGSQFIAPSYRVQGELKHNVGDALSTLDGAVTWNTSAINSLAAGGSGLVQIASAGNKITIGAASSANTIDVRGTGGARVLSGVAKGEVSANSKDAVNGSQLYATNQQVQKNTNDISHLSNSVQDVIEGKTGLVQQSDPEGSVDIAKNSGGDRVSVSGTSGDRRLSGVSNGVADNDAATVGQLRDITGKLGDSSMLAVNSDKANRPQATGKDAIAIGAGASASNANGVAVGAQSTSSGEHSIAIGDNSRSEGRHALALGSGSKATAKNAVALGSGSVAKEENTVSVGDVGHERRITNVGRGVNASDAATVGQMNDGFASLQNYTNRQVDHLNKRIGDVQDKLTAGIASAMALSGIPQAYQPDSSLVGVAGGSYGGASAIAVGVSHISENGHWITKLQASGNSQSDFGGSVGVGYQW
jgi:hypothetical protein